MFMEWAMFNGMNACDEEIVEVRWRERVGGED